MALATNRLSINADHNRFVMRARPLAGTPIEEVLRPEYWAHHAGQLEGRNAEGSRIEIFPEDAEYFGEVIIMAVRHLAMDVKLLWLTVLDPYEEAEEPDLDAHFEFKFIPGGNARHRVLRREDNVVMKEGFATREAARAWARSNMPPRKAA